MNNRVLKQNRSQDIANAREILKKMESSRGWTLIFLETVFLFILIYYSSSRQWPMHNYIWFATIIPLFQACSRYGTIGAIVEGALVTLMYVPTIGVDASVKNDPYGIPSFICMLVFINIFGGYMGVVIGKSRRSRLDKSIRYTARDNLESAAVEREVMICLMSEALELVGGLRAAALCRKEIETDNFEMTGMSADGTELLEITQFGDRHPLVESASTGKAYMTNSAFLSARLDGFPADDSYRSFICAPVRRNEISYGALMVSGKYGDENFSDKDANTISELCDWAASVIGRQEEEKKRVRERAGQERMTEIFSKYVSGSIASAVLENPEFLRGSRKDVAVLVTDIIEFTEISEGLSPRDVVAKLNAYFSRIVGIILDSGGTIDKFVGDCVIAYWGAPFADDNCRGNAAVAAVKISAAIDSLNAEWRNDGGCEFRTGIGVRACEVTAGVIGDKRKKSFTIVGEGVEQTLVMESLTRTYGAGILVCEKIAGRLPDNLSASLIEGSEQHGLGMIYRLAKN